MIWFWIKTSNSIKTNYWPDLFVITRFVITKGDDDVVDENIGLLDMLLCWALSFQHKTRACELVLENPWRCNTFCRWLLAPELVKIADIRIRIRRHVQVLPCWHPILWPYILFQLFQTRIIKKSIDFWLGVIYKWRHVLWGRGHN